MIMRSLSFSLSQYYKLLLFLKRENRGYISSGKILVFGQKGGVFRPEIPGIGGVFENLRHDVYPPIIPSGGAGRYRQVLL